ncbi:glycosyltransferase [Paenibacillus sp. FSL H7-0357]|uniref:MGDG synthase family glycosyltransferase n=1 Tax=Paenibacillus sp. FSL H7-0357 TaxID=1536774 RepID=UPI00068B7C29|nr:glycosyltransferase [Paenibacillus sp. FSL H7-0357]
MKIILFYSSIGQGHISTARSIEKEIRKQNSEAIILQKDIREFMAPVERILDEKLYWFVVKNLPTLFDSLFQARQEQGNSVGSLSSLRNDYSEQKVHEYLLAENPDSILTTHYGAAQVLGNLREKGFIPGIKIGWLHTDYFEGYFPRISKRIDRTFLAHPSLETRWLSAGVFPDLVETSGMPVDIPLNKMDISKECLKHIGFSPYVTTITIASGKEGIGDFPSIVLSLANAIQEHFQIIAVCGRNKKQFKALQRIQRTLPKNIKLEISGFIPHSDLISFIQASDLFITKAGGLSPTEAFLLGKPTVLLSVISGHERENAELFSKLGLAELNIAVKDIGSLVQKLLSDHDKQNTMLAAQQKFRENKDISKITYFLLDPEVKARCTPPTFGLENGHSASNVYNALAKLEIDAQADMEILLSYSTSKNDERIARENPFGHIAIRIGDTVYSSNHKAYPEKESLLQHLSLATYLFGVLPPSCHQEHTSTYGMAYARDTLGFRIKGISEESLQSMHDEAAKIEEEFRLGICKYDVYEYNCADFVVRILQKSGYNIKPINGIGSIITMPLDVFEKVRTAFEGDPLFITELIAYRRLPGSHAAYRFSHFPLSTGQPGRALAQVLFNSSPNKLELMTSKQLTSSIGDDRIYFENLSGSLSKSTFDGFGRSRSNLNRIDRILFKDAKRLHLSFIKSLRIFHSH